MDHVELIKDVRFHPDGTCVASGSDDTKIKLWDLRSKRLLQHYDAHDGPINKVGFHPNGKYLISASDDATVKIWDIRMGNILFTLYSHDGPVTAINFSSCGDYIATGGEDTVVNVWKSNLDYNGDTDTLDDVTGLIAVGGLKESTLKSNIETFLVPENDFDKQPLDIKKSYSKPGLHSYGSVDFNLGQGGVPKSDRTKSDMTGAPHMPFYDMRSPEEEFYRQPSHLECIPDTAFSKHNVDNIPHEISSTVSKIVNQLDLLSNMLHLLDQRVASNESQAKEALIFFKELNSKDEARQLTIQKAQETFNQTSNLQTPQKA
jgi:centriolar protein POC1